MEAHGVSNNNPQISLKQRVQVDVINTVGVGDIGIENMVNSMMKEFTMPVTVLHGAPTKDKVCTERDAVDELETISSYTGQQCNAGVGDMLIQEGKVEYHS